MKTESERLYPKKDRGYPIPNQKNAMTELLKKQMGKKIKKSKPEKFTLSSGGVTFLVEEKGVLYQANPKIVLSQQLLLLPHFQVDFSLERTDDEVDRDGLTFLETKIHQHRTTYDPIGRLAIRRSQDPLYQLITQVIEHSNNNNAHYALMKGRHSRGSSILSGTTFYECAVTYFRPREE